MYISKPGDERLTATLTTTRDVVTVRLRSGHEVKVSKDAVTVAEPGGDGNEVWRLPG